MPRFAVLNVNSRTVDIISMLQAAVRSSCARTDSRPHLPLQLQASILEITGVTKNRAREPPVAAIRPPTPGHHESRQEAPAASWGLSVTFLAFDSPRRLSKSDDTAGTAARPVLKKLSLLLLLGSGYVHAFRIVGARVTETETCLSFVAGRHESVRLMNGLLLVHCRPAIAGAPATAMRAASG